MPATFPLHFRDTLVLWISPIRPGIEKSRSRKQDASKKRGACFDLSIDVDEAKVYLDVGRLMLWLHTTFEKEPGQGGVASLNWYWSKGLKRHTKIGVLSWSLVFDVLPDLKDRHKKLQ